MKYIYLGLLLISSGIFCADTKENAARISVKSVAKCNNCSKTLKKPLSCSQCRATMYCSSTCQKNDWSKHKLKCEKPITDAERELMRNLANSYFALKKSIQENRYNYSDYVSLITNFHLSKNYILENETSANDVFRRLVQSVKEYEGNLKHIIHLKLKFLISQLNEKSENEIKEDLEIDFCKNLLDYVNTLFLTAKSLSLCFYCNKFGDLFVEDGCSYCSDKCKENNLDLEYQCLELQRLINTASSSTNIASATTVEESKSQDVLLSSENQFERTIEDEALAFVKHMQQRFPAFQ